MSEFYASDSDFYAPYSEETMCMGMCYNPFKGRIGFIESTQNFSFIPIPGLDEIINNGVECDEDEMPELVDSVENFY